MKGLFLLLASVFVLISCVEIVEGEGEVLSREYQLRDFKGVVLDVPGELLVSQGEKYINVSTNKNLFEWLNLHVSDSILYISLQDKVNVWRFDELKFVVSLPNPVFIKLDGSGDILIRDSLVTERAMELEIDGAGDIIVNHLSAKSVKLKVDGAGNIRCDDIFTNSVFTDIDGLGDVKLKGKANSHTVLIDGAGDIFSFDMVSENAIVEIDGTGDCELNVRETLNVDIDGAGSVFYKGNPETSITIDGTGSVKKVSD